MSRFGEYYTGTIFFGIQLVALRLAYIIFLVTVTRLIGY